MYTSIKKTIQRIKHTHAMTCQKYCYTGIWIYIIVYTIVLYSIVLKHIKYDI